MLQVLNILYQQTSFCWCQEAIQYNQYLKYHCCHRLDPFVVHRPVSGQGVQHTCIKFTGNAEVSVCVCVCP